MVKKILTLILTLYNKVKSIIKTKLHMFPKLIFNYENNLSILTLQKELCLKLIDFPLLIK